MTNRHYWLSGRFSRFDSLWMMAAGWALGAEQILIALCLIVSGALLSSVLEYCLPEPPQ